MQSSRALVLVAGLALAGCHKSEEAPRHDASRAEPTTHANAAETASPHPAAAPSKAAATPAFWQKDPDAAFPNGGADYCAPVSLSAGLLYLDEARGMSGLWSGRDKKAQIALVKELAKDLATDPKEGTSADLVVTGLRRFADAKGYAFRKLEVSTWRSISRDNEPHHVGQRPELDWIQANVADPETVVLVNVGWYKKEPKGYERAGGHWVVAVGEGRQPAELQIHNSLLSVEEQKTKTAVTLTKLTEFVRLDGKTSANMAGYLAAEGPGLPFGGTTAAAVVDCVVAFSLKKK